MSSSNQSPKRGHIHPCTILRNSDFVSRSFLIDFSDNVSSGVLTAYSRVVDLCLTRNDLAVI